MISIVLEMSADDLAATLCNGAIALLDAHKQSQAELDPVVERLGVSEAQLSRALRRIEELAQELEQVTQELEQVTQERDELKQQLQTKSVNPNA